MNTREIALRLLMEIDRENAQSHRVLQNAWQTYPELSDQDRRFILRVVHGTLEKRLLLDHRINQKSKVPVNKMKPVIRQLMRMSTYQIFFMDRIPNTAVCNEAVKLAAKFGFQGLKGFVNGVLRAIIREENWTAEPDSIRCSIPKWICTNWKENFGEDHALRMMEATQDEHVLYFRILDGEGNPDHADADRIKDSLTASGIQYHEAAFPAGAWYMENPSGLETLEALQRGWIAIQDISSMMVGSLANVKENMEILDVCAAPGGKTLHLAQQLHGTGHITACDLTDYKVSLIRENIERSGWKNITAVRQDARQFRAEWEGRMDLILADLPCSGLGVLGRKPEIRYRVTMKEVEELAALQRQILRNVIRYLKPGGRLIFSTCTVTGEENQQNRRFIIEELGLIPEEFPASNVPEPLRDRTSGGQLQLLPGVDPCDGFYLSTYRLNDTALSAAASNENEV